MGDLVAEGQGAVAGLQFGTAFSSVLITLFGMGGTHPMVVK
jgi:hypothetical protein